MVGESGASNGVSPCEEVHCLKREAPENGFEIRTLTDSGKWSLVPSVGLQTYKRRKFGRSSSESKSQENGRESMEAASKLEDETIMEQLDSLPKNHAFLKDVLHKRCRTFILKRICQSLNNDEGGIKGCILDALKTEIQGIDAYDKERVNCPLEPLRIPNGSHYAARGHIVTSNESLNGPHRTFTEMCQNAFSKIIHSEKFTLLCKLLFENFPELKTDNILSLSPIHRNMKDGTYESSPLSFHSDVQLLWKNLQDFGNELISIAQGLSYVSSTCYNEQFCPGEAYMNGKSEDFDACGAYNVRTCQQCGDKEDVRDFLRCGSSEETHHPCCTEPKEIRPRNWCCGSCTAKGLSFPHEDCIVCARLNAPSKQCAQASDKEGSANEKTCSEASDHHHSRDSFQKEPDRGCTSVCCCKICGSEVANGEKLMICGHPDCSFKYYHMHCLTDNLLKSYGPRWYCPSCLCSVCLNDKDDDKIVLCDGCDHGYHTYCLNPPLDSIPDGKWFCIHCDVKIEKIRRAKRQYEEQKVKEEKHGKCVKGLDEGGEGMDILLTAAQDLLLSATQDFE